MQKAKYLVLTGIRCFPIQALSARDAIEQLKIKIRNRRSGDPDVGESLQHALFRNELNFIVMDEGRTQLLCGEQDRVFQPVVTRELADKFRATLPQQLYYSTR